MGTPIGPNELVEDVLTRSPGTAEVFRAHRMACVGCSLSRFQRIRDAAGTYGLDLAAFLEELRAAAGTGVD